MRILLVEDNEELASLILRKLRSVDFSVDLVADASDARAALKAIQYSALILDLGLPDEDGLGVLNTLRANDDPLPVLILTARGSVDNRVAGLRAGADDYLVKPFVLEELVARLSALLRRPGELLGRSMKLGNLVFDVGGRQVFIGGAPHSFLARELALLELFLRRTGRVLPRKLVEDQIFGLSSEVGSNAIEVSIHRLRKTLADAGANIAIHTVRGVGYIIAEEVN